MGLCFSDFMYNCHSIYLYTGLNSMVINTFVHDFQLQQQRLKFMSDKVVGQSELRKKLGQLLYLKNLSKVSDTPRLLVYLPVLYYKMCMLK